MVWYKLQSAYKSSLLELIERLTKLFHELGSDSNFIPKESKKFEFWNLNKAIRIYIENEPEIQNTRSHDFLNF